MRRTTLAVAVLLCLLASVTTAGSTASTKSPITSSVKPVTPKANRTATKTKTASKRSTRTKRSTRAKRVKRVTRARGLRGKRGARGPRGFTGPRGPAGPAGPAGPQGPKGDAGALGANGAAGAQGPKGDSGASAPTGPATAQVRVLGINDLHGNLEPPSGSSGTTPTGPPATGTTGPIQTTPTGGAAFMATHVKRLSAGRDAVLVGAGDLIGASPLLSGLFHDEPSIEALNAMGMQYAGAGNHEFDEGVNELLRMQFGGCHPTDGCQDGDPFAGAFFRYLAANVRYQNTSRTILPPYLIKRAGGVPVAYIGLTLKDTPKIVTPEGVRGLEFDDEPATINRLVKQLSDEQGVEAFVIIVHEGGQQNSPYPGGFPDVNRCDNPTGDIFNIVPKLSPKVDVVLSAHTHQAYVCQQGNTLVTSSSAFGRLVTSVDLTLDTATKDVVAKTARNELVTRDVTPDPPTQQIIDKYKAIAAPIQNRVVGRITAPITRASNPAGESPLGDVIADAQLAATAAANLGGAKVAFMNPGGIRADLTPAGDVTYGQLYTTQPFANTLVVKTLTGAQLDALLEQQFNNPSPGANRFLQPSKGFTYTFDLRRPAGDRVDASTIKIDGATVSPATGYRVTMNSFLATGGDGFTVFNQGMDQIGGAVDIDALEAYIKANSPVAPGPQDRITQAAAPTT